MIRIRTYYDAVKIAEDLPRVMDCFFDWGIFREWRKCPWEGCNGYLRATKSKREAAKNYDGWMYQCQECHKWKAITHDSAFHGNKLGMNKLFMMLYQYAVISQAVCPFCLRIFVVWLHTEMFFTVCTEKRFK